MEAHRRVLLEVSKTSNHLSSSLLLSPKGLRIGKRVDRVSFNNVPSISAIVKTEALSLFIQNRKIDEVMVIDTDGEDEQTDQQIVGETHLSPLRNRSPGE